MAGSEYIPAGRTSMVKKGEMQLQVQTEYAQRPMPRITTTILHNGQVLNKVERTLDRAVVSLADQAKVETSIKHQHQEVLEIIKDRKEASAASVQNGSGIRERDEEHRERLTRIPGVQQVYILDNDANFYSESGSEEFRRLFGPIFRNLKELLDVFSRVPGVSFTRETGVYEIERDRLYLGSTGTDCFFVVVRRVNVTTSYEREIKEALQIAAPV